jgi:uncharacterized repeat protein (TIGR04076 family)
MAGAGRAKRAGEIAERPTCDRRAFCRGLSCVALAGLPALLNGAAAPTLFAGPRRTGGGHPSKETNMAKKVKEVRAKVLSVKGECSLGHKAGDMVRFTDGGVDGHICIHALYSMMPKVFAMMFNAEFPWAANPDVLTHACPDAFNPVVFELTRGYED